MRRFYFDPKTRNGECVFLSEEESHHIAKVLRLPAGSEVELLDGQGTVYRAVISEIGRRVTPSSVHFCTTVSNFSPLSMP